MDGATLSQIKGLKNFIQDAVEAADSTTARTQQTITQESYTALKTIAPIAVS